MTKNRVIKIILSCLIISCLRWIYGENQNEASEVIAPKKTELILGGTLSGHTKGINSVTFSPNGDILASGSYDKSVRIWNMNNMVQIAYHNHDSEYVLFVDFSSNGKSLISYSAATLSAPSSMIVWNMDTNYVTNFDKKDALFNGFDRLAITSNNIFATFTTDYSLKLFNLNTGEEVSKFAGHTKEIAYSLAFSPDEKTLASGSYDKTIKLWDVKSGEELKTFTGHRDWIFPIAFSPNGKLLVSGSLDNTLRVWDVETGEEITSLRRNLSPVKTIDFHPNGKTLVTGSIDNTVRLWRIDDMEEVATYTMPEVPREERPWTWSPTSRVNSVDFSPDGKK